MVRCPGDVEMSSRTASARRFGDVRGDVVMMALTLALRAQRRAPPRVLPPFCARAMPRGVYLR